MFIGLSCLILNCMYACGQNKELPVAVMCIKGEIIMIVKFSRTYPLVNASEYHGSQSLLMKGCTQIETLNPRPLISLTSCLKSGSFLSSTVKDP